MDQLKFPPKSIHCIQNIDSIVLEYLFSGTKPMKIFLIIWILVWSVFGIGYFLQELNAGNEISIMWYFSWPIMPFSLNIFRYFPLAKWP